MTELLWEDGTLLVGPALALVAAVVLIGFASGGLPGVASLAAPVLTLTVPFEQAQAVVLPLFLLGQLAGTIAHWHSIHWKELVFLVLLSSVGIIVGWLIWIMMLGNPDFPAMRRWLKCGTACLILMLAWNLYRTRIHQPPVPSARLGTSASIFWCVMAGTLSTIANVSGSLVVWYLNTRHLKKEELTSTVAASYLVINALKIIPYTALGFYDLSNVSTGLRQDALVWIPVLLLMAAAILTGRWRLQRTTPRRFNVALVTAMVIVACGILWQEGPDLVRSLMN